MCLFLQIIARESERLTALIENVLDFAKFERGKSAFDFHEGAARALRDEISAILSEYGVPVLPIPEKRPDERRD